jgi:hypothetical protein
MYIQSMSGSALPIVSSLLLPQKGFFFFFFYRLIGTSSTVSSGVESAGGVAYMCICVYMLSVFLFVFETKSI